jgi:hypothetical protein
LDWTWPETLLPKRARVQALGASILGLITTAPLTLLMRQSGLGLARDRRATNKTTRPSNLCYVDRAVEYDRRIADK